MLGLMTHCMRNRLLRSSQACFEYILPNYSLHTNNSEQLILPGILKHMEKLKSANHPAKPIVDRVDVLLCEHKELRTLADDPELASEVDKDLQDIASKINDTVAELLPYLLDQKATLTDFNSTSEASMEVVPGAGGLEACLFAEEIFNFYVAYARFNGFDVEVTCFDPASVGKNASFSSSTGIKKAVARITGQGIFSFLKYETGVHRVQRVPITGTKSDRLQTSTCSVAVLPKADVNSNVPLPESDLKIDFVKASGPGGQNVNKINSCCQVTHLPTGTFVECKENRKPLDNKKMAIEKLRTLIYQQQFESEMNALRIGNMDRNEKVRTYNWSRNQITDHRISMSMTVKSLSDFLEGDGKFGPILELHKELVKQERQEQIERLLNT